ncbi:hypothetical protein Tco_0744626 [Tanacetum coccineum]
MWLSLRVGLVKGRRCWKSLPLIVEILLPLGIKEPSLAMNVGIQGTTRSDCLELKNQNHGNQAEGTGARGLVHALGGGEADQDLNDIEDDISA